MRLKSGIIATCCCLLACSLVSGKATDVVAAKDDDMMVPKVRPTVAPLRMSTIKPTLAPMKPATPTKAIVLNIPPKLNRHMEEKNPAMTISAAQSETPMKDLKLVPESANNFKDEAMATDQASDAKPVQVTGFITKNGSIYEVEDKDGIGLIEGRQNPIDEKMNVCNYGNIVIYSDVPCEEVTNIRVGDVVQTTLKDEKDQLQQTQGQNQQQQQQNLQQQNSNTDQVLDGFEDAKPPRRRNGQKRKRNQQKNQIRRRPNKNKNRQKAPANRNQQRRRHQQTQQQRKKQQQQKRSRLQNQQYSTQRRQHNNHNRVQQRPQRQRNRKGNTSRRDSNINHNRRRNQRLEQARRRQQEYGRGRFDEDY